MQRSDEERNGGDSRHLGSTLRLSFLHSLPPYLNTGCSVCCEAININKDILESYDQESPGVEAILIDSLMPLMEN